MWLGALKILVIIVASQCSPDVVLGGINRWQVPSILGNKVGRDTVDPAGCPEAPSAIRWASSTLQLGEWPRKVMRIRPSQLSPAGTRGADAGQPGLLFGGHGPSGEYNGSYAHHHWESPCSHTGPKGNVGVWGAFMPLEQEALFLGESCTHQKLSGSKARGASRTWSELSCGPCAGGEG